MANQAVILKPQESAIGASVSMGESNSSVSETSTVTPSPTGLDPASRRSQIAGVAVGVLIILYLATALPAVAGLDAPIVDEPIFASSAYEFAESGTVIISQFSAPNAVFEAAWGGAFVRILGEGITSLRVSSVVLVALSAPFMYMLCRRLGGSRSSSVLGTGAYLFAPLAFVLATTFQTDPHMMALIVMALAATVVGLQAPTHQILLLASSSVLVSIAFLSRPQALVVTGAAVIAWATIGPTSQRWVGIAALTLIPASVFAVHSTWVATVGEPFVRSLSRQALLERNPSEIAGLAAQSLVGFFIYTGLFVIPLIPLLRRIPTKTSHRRSKIYMGTGLAVLATAMILTGQGPFDHQEWITTSGLGAVDRSLLGSRPELAPMWVFHILTVLLLMSAFVLLTRRRVYEARQGSSVTHRFVLLSIAGFALAAFVSSLALQGRVFDRYWLPVLPLIIALGAARGIPTRARTVASSALVSVLALVSVIGTRDAFSTYADVNDFADDVVASGVDELLLDGGASWSAATFGLNDQSPRENLERAGPYWLRFYAVDSRPEFGVALEPLDGYRVLTEREYDSVLHVQSTSAYLLQRDPEHGFYIRTDDF